MMTATVTLGFAARRQSCPQNRHCQQPVEHSRMPFHRYNQAKNAIARSKAYYFLGPGLYRPSRYASWFR
jgi:hypothetical protein